jgi:c(7)-type cytochrome triheme protein
MITLAFPSRRPAPALAATLLALHLAMPAAAQQAPSIHDSDNPDHARLQSLQEAARLLPRDARGSVDWMAALRSGAIAPRADLAGSARPQPLELDVILKNTKDMPYVRFPHRAHSEWLACSNCHDQLFVPKAGANPISMDAIFRGQYCGACHGRVAFVSHLNCERCHSVAHDGLKPWW